MAPGVLSNGINGSSSQMEFRRPVFRVLNDPEIRKHETILSLPDLLEFNDRNNPNHTFALQQVKKDGEHAGFRHVTFRALKQAVDSCAEWIKNSLERTPVDARGDSSSEEAHPVALFLESDLTLFIHFCALLWMEIPVVLLSARLGPTAISHLLRETRADTILVSNRTRPSAVRGLEQLGIDTESPLLAQVEPYTCFLPENIQALGPIISKNRGIPRVEDHPGSVILHSSGTTGLPKPIRLAHRYLLSYAACHRLSPDESDNQMNLSTLPLYHGFGLLAPCLSFSVGMPCCLPASSVIPSASSTVDLLTRSGARSLMTVPTILEEITANSESRDLEALAKLNFVAVGGGPIKLHVGEALVTGKVNLLNHYGATEIGPIAPIFVPDNQYDWHWLRLRSDASLEINRVEPEDGGEDIWKLIGYPFGWGRSFDLQDRLVKNAAAPDGEIEVKILGRKDDMIVLATGEKVLPQHFETVLNAQKSIRTAVVFGDHQDEIGILIEPHSPLPADQYQHYVESVWTLVSELNQTADRHARISSPDAIIIKPEDKIIPRSDKGSVLRKEVANIFRDEIELVYSNLSHAAGASAVLDPENLAPSLTSLIQSCVGDRIHLHDIPQQGDFFEGGMDSLEATRIARQLNSLSNKSSFPGLVNMNVRADFIYQNPTITKLVRALTEGNSVAPKSRDIEMLDVAHRAVTELLHYRPRTPITILITGSTGGLGVNLLEQLCRNPQVERIICVNRRGEKAGANGTQGNDSAQGISRQQAAFESKGVSLTEEAWKKISILQTNTQDDYLGLKAEQYMSLVQRVTHIIHNAWPMNFQRQLASFESQIQSLSNIVRLSFDIHNFHPHVRPRVLFTSSIAVGARYSESLLPEDRIHNPLWTTPMGYAEAKWVCEKILEDVSIEFPDRVDPVIVRVGQLSGSTQSGYWSTAEHFPALVSASAATGVLPNLTGTYSWLPVDVAATTISELLLNEQHPSKFYHVENPTRASFEDLTQVLGKKLGILSVIPLEDWISHVSSKTDKITNLEEFFRHDFINLSSGNLVLDTKRTQEASPTLRSCGPVSEEALDKYISFWRRHGLL